MNIERDPKMGRALERIPLPGFSDDYYARLERRLEEERAPAIPARRRSRLARALLAAAAVAAAAVFAFVVLPALHGTDTASAADMLASLNAAAGNARTVRLSITELRDVQTDLASPSSDATAGTSSAPRRTSEQLTLSTSGDVRYSSIRQLVDAASTQVETHMIETYDARRHESMRQGRTMPAGGASTPTPNPYGDRRRGALLVQRPSWGTTVFSTFLYANFQALSNSLRALLAASDPDTPVSEITYLGRPAWHAELKEVMSTSDAGEIPVIWSVTVDKETGLLVSSDLRSEAGRERPKGLARSFRVTRLEVDPSLPAGWQRIPEVGQAEIAIFDDGTRFGTPASVAKRSWPTLVLVPQSVPGGYHLTDVATRDYEGMARPAGDRQNKLVYLSRSHPRKYLWKRTSVDASAQRVMLRFRRGLSTFVISIKPLRQGGGSLGAATAGRLGSEDVTLSSGYLKGARARTWISPYFGAGPTLLTYSDRSRITITGDLTREELIDVANSLQAYGDVEKPLPAGYGD